MTKSKRKTEARIWLAVTFLLLTAAHYCFFRFCTDPLNVLAPLTRGMTFGCILWTSVLLGIVWFRHGWARYVLITLICLAIVGFGTCGLVLLNEAEGPMPHAQRMVIAGLLFYAIALVPLGSSRAVARYVAPREAGD